MSPFFKGIEALRSFAAFLRWRVFMTSPEHSCLKNIEDACIEFKTHY